MVLGMLAVLGILIIHYHTDDFPDFFSWMRFMIFLCGFDDQDVSDDSR